MKTRHPIALAVLAVPLVLGTSQPQTAGAPAATWGDSIPVVKSEFRSEQATLITGFGQLMQKAVDPAATHTARAHLVLYLRAVILPHARAEEEVLYPVVDSVLGTKGYATATMVLDHRAVERLVDDLSALASSPYPEAYRRKLYALDAVLETHFAKEEAFILPILRRKMTESELHILIGRMAALSPSDEAR